MSMPHAHIATDDPRRLNRRKLIRQSAAALALPALMKAAPTRQGDNMPESPGQSGYAPVNGLQMYYEIHGQGEPLLLLHGAFGTVELWGPILETLAANRQVIAVELQGHGRTVDIDRPLTYEQLADDSAEFMRHLGVAQADVFGYSLGGITALGLAIENPDLVRKLVVVGAIYNNEGYYPESLAAIKTLTPEMFAGSPPEMSYKAVAPDPEGFPALVAKVAALDDAFGGWREADVEAITSPALIVNGDADIRPEHAVQLFRLLGGGVAGDLVGLPRSRLAILPGTTHVGLVVERADWLVAMTEDFLNAPLPATP
jgi:pimeloyl-ACP methyl ester carboxylesterase